MLSELSVRHKNGPVKEGSQDETYNYDADGREKKVFDENLHPQLSPQASMVISSV